MRLAAALLAALLLCACPDDKLTSGETALPETGPDSEAPECSEDDTCEAWEICEDDVCVDGDRNESSDEAEPLGWEEPLSGYLNPAEDVDWFSIESDGGQFVRVSTRPTGAESGEPVASEDMDTVLILYDPSGDWVVWEDDYPTGGVVNGYDTIIYAYLAEAGTYSLAVMDASTAYDRDEKLGGADFSYVVELQEYGSPPDEPDSFEDPGADRDLESSGYFYPVPILLEEESDSDWIELTLPYGDCPMLVYGSANIEGSDALPRLRLYTAEQELLLDLDELGTNGVALYPDIDGGKALAEATDAEGGGGDNHWFFLIFKIYDEGYSTSIGGVEFPYQVESEPNGSLEQAQLVEQLSVETDSGDEYTAAFLWGTIGEAGDEDWYAIHGSEDWNLTVYGTADYNGSLLNPALELYDASGERLQYWYDGSDLAPDLLNEHLDSDGTYYLRLYDEDESDEGGAAWFYRLSIYVTDFTVE